MSIGAPLQRPRVALGVAAMMDQLVEPRIVLEPRGHGADATQAGRKPRKLPPSD
jgi:hypothetical protein